MVSSSRTPEQKYKRPQQFTLRPFARTEKPGFSNFGSAPGAALSGAQEDRLDNRGWLLLLGGIDFAWLE
jgi:hypothetical protein